MARFQTVFAARERRGAFRYDVRVKAGLALDHKTPSIECVIRDISREHRGRLHVDPGGRVHPRFLAGVPGRPAQCRRQEARGGIPAAVVCYSVATRGAGTGGQASGVSEANPLNSPPGAGVAQW
jgi:hypothetical protein